MVAQFGKRRPFASLKDTKSAVLKPLEAVGQSSLFRMPPDELLDDIIDSGGSMKLEDQLQDLHYLTGGRPYEIQLVCHFMFRRVQQGRDREMRLSIIVLEDVLRELKQSHDVDSRPIISAVRNLDEEELKSLDVLLRSSGKVDVDKLLFAAFVTGKTEKLPDQERETLRTFVASGILGEVDRAVVFLGDDFEKIVCKYAARQRDVHLSFDPVPPERILLENISKLGRNRGRGRRVGKRNEPSLVQLLSTHARYDDSRAAISVKWPSLEGSSFESLCEEVPHVLLDNYHFCVTENPSGHSRLHFFKVDVAGVMDFTEFFYLIEGDDYCESLEKVRTYFESLEKRVQTLGCSLRIEERKLIGCTVDEIVQIASKSGCVELSEVCGTAHCQVMFDLYINHKNRNWARMHADWAYQFRESFSKSELNQLGYILIASDESTKAVSILQEATAKNPEDLLVRYNLAIANLQIGEIERSREMLERIQVDLSECRYGDIVVLQFVECDLNGRFTLVEKWIKAFSPESELEEITLNDAVRIALNEISKNSSV